MTNAEEKAYIRGRNTAFARMLQLCRDELDPEDTNLASLLRERVATVEALRRLCARVGDNDWPDNAHLGDVIEKHLGRYLEDDE